MRLFGLGPIELLIIMLIVLPATLVPAVGLYRIAQRAGYGSSVSVLLGVGSLLPLGSWFVPLFLGFAAWPREQALVVAPASAVAPPPAPPAL